MERNLRKTRVGKVVSDKMDKTIVVAIVLYLSLNVHNLLMIKFSGIVTSKFTIGAIVLLTLKNVTSIQSKTLERIDVPP